MTAMIQGDQVRSIALGLYAEKVGAAPSVGSDNLFSVSGGLVIVTSLVGIVTTVQGAVANSTNLQHTPTGGAAADICAATVTTSDAVGTIYTITGVETDLLSAQAVAGIQVPSVTFGLNLLGAGRGLVLPAGTITQLTTAVTTGAITWHLTYVPLETGAAVAAAA